MSTVELRSSLHKIIDQIKDARLLQALIDFLKDKETNQEGEMWDSLTEEQKNEVLAALEESEDETSLIDVEKFLKDNKWK